MTHLIHGNDVQCKNLRNLGCFNQNLNFKSFSVRARHTFAKQPFALSLSKRQDSDRSDVFRRKCYAEIPLVHDKSDNSEINMGDMIDEVAAVDAKNQELMKQIIHFTRILRMAMKQVEFSAKSTENGETDQEFRTALWKEHSMATTEALEGVISQGEAMEDAIADWKLQKRLQMEQRKVSELKNEQQRVRHSLDAAAARLAEASARLYSAKAKGDLADEMALFKAQSVVGIANSGGSNGILQKEPESELGEKGAEADDAALGPDTVSLPVTHQCVVGHPGALSCTKTTIRKDDVRHTAVISMETTVRCAGDACLAASIEGDDYIALGLQALADSATELNRSQFQRTTKSNPQVQEKHRRIVDILRSGEIVSCSPMEPPSTFGHISFVARLRSRETGEEIQAMVKPRVEGDADGWNRASVEWVAYELNLLLGMDYVPPVFYRTGGMDLNWIHFEEAAFIYWAPHCRQLDSVAPSKWGVSVAHLLSDTRVLDVLLNNSDRHHGHFFLGEHWMDGKMHPVLIDHAAGFRKEAVVTLQHENAFGTGPVRCIAASTYLRLRFLSQQMLTEKFSSVLTSGEIIRMMKRKDEMLTYFDGLVKERGYHRTVIE